MNDLAETAKNAASLYSQGVSNTIMLWRLTLEATILFQIAAASAWSATGLKLAAALPFSPRSNATGARTEASARVLDLQEARTRRSRRKLTVV